VAPHGDQFARHGRFLDSTRAGHSRESCPWGEELRSNSGYCSRCCESARLLRKRAAGALRSAIEREPVWFATASARARRPDPAQQTAGTCGVNRPARNPQAYAKEPDCLRRPGPERALPARRSAGHQSAEKPGPRPSANKHKPGGSGTAFSSKAEGCHSGGLVNDAMISTSRTHRPGRWGRQTPRSRRGWTPTLRPSPRPGGGPRLDLPNFVRQPSSAFRRPFTAHERVR